MNTTIEAHIASNKVVGALFNHLYLLDAPIDTVNIKSKTWSKVLAVPTNDPDRETPPEPTRAAVMK